VYVGIVERANNGNGELYVRVQNGYELNELHDVQITTPPSAGALLVYDATNALWKAARLTAGTNIAITNADASVTVGITGTIALGNGGTGQTTAQAAINSLAAATTSGYFLRGNGTNVVMAAISAGDVPTLNQNTTGSAATLTTARAIYGNNFDGSAALTQAITGTYGGTGVNNGANTITLAGNVTHAGAFTQTFTATANTALTLPVTGTLATLAGSEALSNKTITASAFNGTVGATTPSTGAFTSITGTTTLKIGTASSFGGTIGQLNGANVAQANGVGMVSIASTDAVAADKGGSLALAAKATGGAETNPYPMAVISGRAVNAIDLSGYFAVALSDGAGTIAEKMRLSSTGLAVTGALSASGNLNFTGTGNRITGDFSNATLTNRVAFQSSTTNGATTIYVLPNGTGTTSGVVAWNNSDPTNASNIALLVGSADSRVQASLSGTGTYLPLTFHAGGGERARIDTSGNVGIGTASPAQRLHVNSSSASVSPITTTSVTGDTTYQAILVTKFDNDSTTSQNFIQFQINNGGANCGKITANGANTAAFGSTSDRRVKENIADLPSQLANIMALRPVEFDYVESYGGGHQIGFVAQEMQQVYPDVIAEDASEEKILSITGWSKTEARLVKALQELNANLVAQVAALSQRLAALENS
jgi:hypothetical protein